MGSRLSKIKARQGAAKETPYPSAETLLRSLWDRGASDEVGVSDDERLGEFSLILSNFCEDPDKALEALLFTSALRSIVEKREPESVVGILRQQFEAARRSMVGEATPGEEAA